MKPYGFDYSDERYKVLFANFGLCSLKAQVIEHQLAVITTATRYLGTGSFNVTEFRQTLNADKRTMGQLIKALRVKIEVPVDLEEILKKALEDRNYIIHHFFMKKCLQMGQVESAPEMTAEIISIGRNFEVAIEKLDQIMEKLQKIADLPYAQIKEDAKNLFTLEDS